MLQTYDIENLLYNKEIKVNGRTVRDQADGFPLSLVWSGSSIEFDIKASELHILVEGPYEIYENWIAVEIDGEILQRRPLNKNKEWITVFRMVSPDRITHVRLIKEDQAMSFDASHCINIYSVKHDGNILPNINDNKLKNKLKIEFIGDSLTSGEGCIGDRDAMDWITMYFSHTRSYPYYVSKKLDADYRLISLSGWGLYSSWDNRTDCAIPLYYEQICSILPEGPLKARGFGNDNDFNAWQPDYIVVNLGTNDNGAFHNDAFVDENGVTHKLHMQGDDYATEDADKIINACIDFCHKLRSNNAKSRIIWAYGLCDSHMFPYLQKAIDLYKNKYNDDRIYIIPLEPVDNDSIGSRMHPGMNAHKKVAEQICDFIRYNK